MTTLNSEKMTTLEEIKKICSQTEHDGLSESEARSFFKYQNSLYWAWENWGDEITKPFWGGDEKPEYPTESFMEDYFYNFDFEAEFNIEAE